MSRPRHLRSKRIGRYLPPLGSEFVSIETGSSLALIAAAVAAMIWANVDPSSYADAWNVDVGPLTTSAWINDALMAIFFFVVGLEVKRELVEGELRDPRHAALPAIAAVGGMVVPALVFTAWNAGGPGAPGWGIPMATDIALALGVLALLGSRVRPVTKLFLVALAIVDDVGSILVIALFYSAGVDVWWLIGAVAACASVVALRRVGVDHVSWFVIPGVALWVCIHEAGVSATIAGVILAMLLPTAPGEKVGPVERLEHSLHPWAGFVVVPLFALANAGVNLDITTVTRALESPVTLGIVTGRVIGKTVGITAFAWLAIRFGWARLPRGLDHMQILAVAIVGGIGFTVSLFVAELALPPSMLDVAKLGILASAVIAGTLGLVSIALAGRARRSEPRQA